MNNAIIPGFSDHGSLSKKVLTRLVVHPEMMGNYLPGHLVLTLDQDILKKKL